MCAPENGPSSESIRSLYSVQHSVLWTRLWALGFSPEYFVHGYNNNVLWASELLKLSGLR